MKRSDFCIRILAVAAAIVMLIASLSACGGSNNSASSKCLDADLAYALEKVSDFSHFEIRNSATFSEDAFSKANAAAMMISGRDSAEDLEKIVRFLKLDSLTVADETGVIIAACPDGEVGKRLKETDKKSFGSIVKNITTKQMDLPALKEDGSYGILAGVKREDGTGAVVVGFTSDSYADICGETLAEKCGNNTVVIKDDLVFSSTFAGASYGTDTTAVGMGPDVLEKGSFGLTFDGNEYSCKCAVTGAYTVVCVEPV